MLKFQKFPLIKNSARNEVNYTPVFYTIKEINKFNITMLYIFVKIKYPKFHLSDAAV